MRVVFLGRTKRSPLQRKEIRYYALVGGLFRTGNAGNSVNLRFQSNMALVWVSADIFLGEYEISAVSLNLSPLYNT